MGFWNRNERQHQEEPERQEREALNRRILEHRQARLDWYGTYDSIQSRLRGAQAWHAQAKAVYNRYAPGPQKDDAGAKMNQAADAVAALERELVAHKRSGPPRM